MAEVSVWCQFTCSAEQRRSGTSAALPVFWFNDAAASPPGADLSVGRSRSAQLSLSQQTRTARRPRDGQPRQGGSIDKFDDLPARWHANVNRTEVPYDRQPGQAPALDEREIDDLIAFLATLEVGWGTR
jgi:hypothetical protein